MVWDVAYTCDICGRKKGEANHWWMLTLGDVSCFDEGQPGKRFTLMPWDANESQDREFYHLCGQSCAMTAMERFMNTGAILVDQEEERPRREVEPIREVNLDDLEQFR